MSHNGVCGKIANGYIERIAGDEASMRIVKISYFVDENLTVGPQEAIMEAKACEDFEQGRERAGIPASEADINWCLRAAYSHIVGVLANILEGKFSSAYTFPVVRDEHQSSHGRPIGSIDCDIRVPPNHGPSST